MSLFIKSVILRIAKMKYFSPRHGVPSRGDLHAIMQLSFSEFPSRRALFPHGLFATQPDSPTQLLAHEEGPVPLETRHVAVGEA